MPREPPHPAPHDGLPRGVIGIVGSMEQFAAGVQAGIDAGIYDRRDMPMVLASAQRPKGNGYGFVEPAPWPCNGSKRREAVLDVDHHPALGWQNCRKPFWSDDTRHIRMCKRCKAPEPDPTEAAAMNPLYGLALCPHLMNLIW